jgi:hypothetical protein
MKEIITDDDFMDEFADTHTLIKHGEVKLIDYCGEDGCSCAVCNEKSAYLLTLGQHSFHLCYECIANIGHCVIDGLR